MAFKLWHPNSSSIFDSDLAYTPTLTFTKTPTLVVFIIFLKFTLVINHPEILFTVESSLPSGLPPPEPSLNPASVHYPLAHLSPQSPAFSPTHLLSHSLMQPLQFHSSPLAEHLSPELCLPGVMPYNVAKRVYVTHVYH